MNNVISSRVSVFRNVKDFKFENKLTPEQKQEIVNMVETAVKGKMMLANVKNIDEQNLNNLKNLGLILGNTQNIFVDKKENIVINMFNGEHLTIVSAVDTYDKAGVEKAVSLAQNLANKISFAFSDQYGYLMSDLSKIGAGIKLETNIMLSAIKSINKIEQVKQNVAKLGYALNETKFPAIYTLSTMCNLGIGEKQIISDFENTLSKLQDLEIESVKMLDVSNHDEILDKTQRSLAILKVAHMLNYEELYNMLVNLRIGLNLGLTDLDINIINRLQKLVLNKKNDYVTQDDMRELASKVKQILKGEKNV